MPKTHVISRIPLHPLALETLASKLEVNLKRKISHRMKREKRKEQVFQDRSTKCTLSYTRSGAGNTSTLHYDRFPEYYEWLETKLIPERVRILYPESIVTPIKQEFKLEQVQIQKRQDMLHTKRNTDTRHYNQHARRYAPRL
ncbi:MAG: hypothetical protein QXS38_01150 [Candidatus Pacearchaeota archaeon]